MDKPNFKKFALMGMAGGMLLASQNPVGAISTEHFGTVVAAGCSGRPASGSCGGRRGNSQTAYNEHTCGGHHQAGGQPQRYGENSGCNSKGSQPGMPGDPQNYYKNTAYETTPNTQQQRSQTFGTRTMSENEFVSQLDPQTRSTYLNLSPEGKALALRLAGQDTYIDKNQAVRDAAKQISAKGGTATFNSYNSSSSGKGSSNY